MNANTEKMLQYLDKSRAILKDAVEQVPADLRDTRPSPDEWSIAEILEHLTIVDLRFIQRWTTGLAMASPHIGTVRDISIDSARVMDRSQKIMAADAVRPSGEVSWEVAFQGLEEARKKLRDELLHSDDMDLGDSIYPHPLLGKMNLYQWAIFLGDHEMRHAAQIREHWGRG